VFYAFMFVLCNKDLLTYLRDRSCCVRHDLNKILNYLRKIEKLRKPS